MGSQKIRVLNNVWISNFMDTQFCGYSNYIGMHLCGYSKLVGNENVWVCVSKMCGYSNKWVLKNV